MNERRWFNNTQPQTLQIAVILLYIDAAFSLIFGGLLFFFPIGLIITVAMAAERSASRTNSAGAMRSGSSAPASTS